ncbi:ccch-1 [Pristionchus pacificus]|uniref:Ccch-1 n=1 Tax=Pristionchus pacificus TaxID=54126 RepID=A0A2A6C9R1_PRIPA|nr:ccch-1 [Pristionchus pacificus]|eukprot:PDM74952.1 ccch-1 [Pristionchus pacificus]
MLDPPYSSSSLDKLTSLFPPVQNSTQNTSSLFDSQLGRPNQLLFNGSQSLFDSSSLSDANLLEWSHAANPLNSSTENNLSDDILSLSLLASLSPNAADSLSVQSAHLAQLQMAALAAATRYNSALAGVQSAQSRRPSSSSFTPSLHSPITAPSTPIHGQKAVSPTSPTGGSSFNHAPKNPKLYKTELCRSWMDIGRCNYGERCQYAHGEHEKRPIPRHPKYKTEACQSYHQSGYCPYGPRCHFIHNESEMMAAQMARQRENSIAAAQGKQQVLKMDAGSLNPLLTSQLSPLLSAAMSNAVNSNDTNSPSCVLWKCRRLAYEFKLRRFGYSQLHHKSVNNIRSSGSESPIGSFSPSLDIDDTPLGILTGFSSLTNHGLPMRTERRVQLEDRMKMDGLMQNIVSWTIDDAPSSLHLPSSPTSSSSSSTTTGAGSRLPVFAQLSNPSQ